MATKPRKQFRRLGAPLATEIAKSVDPGSVVREGENTVKRVKSIAKVVDPDSVIREGEVKKK